MDGALAVWLGFLAVVIGVTTVWRVIRAGRDDGADARSLGLVTADAPDAQPMSTVRVQVSESGPMPFGYRRCTLEVHPSALVFRGSRVDPLVIPRDRIGCIELKRGPTGSRATVFDTSGRRSALSFIAGGARIRDALSAGGALGLIDGA
jgi:hypothetical protein